MSKFEIFHDGIIWRNENNELHREDGPAIEHSNGHKAWYLNGQRHREDGPAVMYYNGSSDWYYKNKYIKCSSLEEFIKIIKMKAFW